MGKVIGIVPQATLFEDEFPHHDRFLFANPYVRQITRQGATPVGILCADGRAQESVLTLCDGFLITGGKKIWPYHLQIIEHAHKHRKPVLGICLGMQAIGVYFRVLEETRKQGGVTGILAVFDKMKRERFMFTQPVQQHQLDDVTRDTARRSQHAVILQEGTRLHEAMRQTQMDAVSLHSYRIASVSAALMVSALAADGTVEGIEYGGFIVGVQFHPEVEDAWEPLFEAFVHDRWREK